MEQQNPSRLALGQSTCFQPVLDRSTSCVVVKFRRKEEVLLVLSLGSRADTQVVRINPSSGRLEHDSRQGVGNFISEAEALDYLSDTESFEILERGCALLGYAPIGSIGMLLLATRLRSAAVLPGGHLIRLVAESRWLQISLLEYAGEPLMQPELERVENMQRFTLNNAHYFCETADVTRAFPSRHPVSEPSWEFVWNRWIAASLREVGLGDHCPHLLQGVVESRTLEDANFDKYMLVLLSRRSRLHPGMRYIARGLNRLASPGNEIECEQLLCTCSCSGEGEPLQWSSYVWRRGTVPIWWGVELKSGGVGEATINVNARNPYRGTARYFRRLQRRYQADLGLPPFSHQKSEEGSAASSPTSQSAAGSEDEVANGEARVPITCINLLRCNMQRKDELLLSEHFSEGVRQARKSMPGAAIRVLNFDWHGAIKELKDQATVEGLWALLEGVLPQTDISVGTLEERRGSGQAAAVSGRGAQPPGRETLTDWDGRWRAHWHSQQCGVIRYNCADSLDRTNAASYFAAVQVLAEQARRLGIAVENQAKAHRQQPSRAKSAARRRGQDLGGALAISSIHQRVRNMMKARVDDRFRDVSPPAVATAGPAGPLPAGWEERQDPSSGRTFFVDHNSKVTTWERPTAAAALDVVSTVADAAHLTQPPSNSHTSDYSEGSDTDASRQPHATAEKPHWGLFGLSVAEMRERLRADLVAAHAEIFLINGDINSNLYTSSRAMHSAIIGLLQGESGAVSKAGVGRLANLGVTLQRRWANVLSDSTRQVVLECFLGLRLKEHFPTQTPIYGGESGVPLDEDSDDEKDLPDEGLPVKDKLLPPPELTNQTTLTGINHAASGASVPATAAALQLQERDPGAFLSPAVEAPELLAASAQELTQHPLL